MMKKKEELLDLTQYEDYEIQNMGLSFLQDLVGALDKHEMFYKSNIYFRYLADIHSMLKAQLQSAENRAD